MGYTTMSDQKQAKIENKETHITFIVVVVLLLHRATHDSRARHTYL